jgi:hypothetical protein
MLPFFVLSSIGMFFSLSLAPEGFNGDLYAMFQTPLLTASMIPLFIWSLVSPLQFGVAADTGSFIATLNPILIFRFVKKSPN